MTAPVKEKTTFKPTHYQQLVNGQWEDARSGKRFTRTSPFDGSPVATYPDSGVADAEAAIVAARHAFDATSWPTRPAAERAGILLRAAKLLRDSADEFTDSIAREVGKPMWMSDREAPAAAAGFESAARLAVEAHGDAITQQTPTALGLTIKEPIGVVGVITPWNYPLILVARKVGTALAAGCTVVCKPSHYSSGAALLMARVLAEAGLPAGALNVVTSSEDEGALVGQYISFSDKVDMVTFTGSTDSGKAVMRAAANNVKRVALELGGKSPNVIFADADLEAAAEGAIAGVFNNSGQICQAGSRLLVQKGVKDEVVQRVVRLMGALTLGDPLDPKTKLGPLVNERQLKRVERYLSEGKKEANLVVGGGRPTDHALANGHFIEPTLFDEVDPASSIAREEIFGPVLSVIEFDSAADAVRIGNDTIFGLAAAVWTKNIDTAINVAKGLRAGSLWVNCYHGAGISGQPFGGYKQSGLGR
ncbi:MAG: aldehyde dehydrogenase family protein, partial [Opitutaceae bacterium]